MYNVRLRLALQSTMPVSVISYETKLVNFKAKWYQGNKYCDHEVELMYCNANSVLYQRTEHGLILLPNFDKFDPN